jgi:3-hydroxyisobutyrate dehydrogenase-like beta-hydroxyacid dehydrogenase
MNRGNSQIAWLGFGEVGALFSHGLVATGIQVKVYDPLFHDATAAPRMNQKAQRLGIHPSSSLEEALNG